MKQPCDLVAIFSKPHENMIDKWFCFYIAVIPIIYVYNFPVINVSIGTVLLFCFVPHAVYKIIISHEKKRGTTCVSITLLLYFIYLTFRSDGIVKQIVLYCIAYIVLHSVLKGSINTEAFRQNIEFIAVINSIVIFLQVVAHYLFHYNLQIIQYSLLQQDYKATYASVATDLFSLYRPSGFFLEPAFNSQYCLFALISCLFSQSKNPRYKHAFIICAGIILSTSGMGIILMASIVVWFVLFYQKKLNKRIKRIVVAISILIIILPVISKIPFFQNAMARVFSNFDGYNAVEGRTGNWRQALSLLNGQQIIIGLGGTTNYQWYLSGFPDTIYKFGIIGVTLKLLIFVQIMIHKRSNYIWCCSIVYIILFCVAHLTGAFLDLFYICVILANYNSTDRVCLPDKYIVLGESR